MHDHTNFEAGVVEFPDETPSSAQFPNQEKLSANLWQTTGRTRVPPD